MSDVIQMKDNKHNHIERKHVRTVLVWSVAPSLNLKNLIFFQVTVQFARTLAIKGKI